MLLLQQLRKMRLKTILEGKTFWWKAISLSKTDAWNYFEEIHSKSRIKYLSTGGAVMKLWLGIVWGDPGGEVLLCSQEGGRRCFHVPLSVPHCCQTGRWSSVSLRNVQVECHRAKTGVVVEASSWPTRLAKSPLISWACFIGPSGCPQKLWNNDKSIFSIMC